MALLQLANRRHFQRHPLQLLLAVLGIALGVAMWVSVDLAIESSRRAFDLSMKALTGRTTHHIVAGSGTLDETLYVHLRREAGDIIMAPAIEGFVEASGETLRLTGVDLFAELPMQEGLARSASAAPPELLTEPDTVLISRLSAGRLGVEPGGMLALDVAGAPRTLRVLGYLDPAGEPDPALEGMLLADIATAQEVLDKLGRLDRIDVMLPAETGQDRLRSLLPQGIEVVDAAGRASATARMSHAFEINLRAMSLLALLVGTFLIYNTMSFAVLQRRRLLADLRTLGATRRELLGEILAEAAILGLVGGALGLLLGLFAAEFLVERVTRTINDVYFVLTVTQFLVSPVALLRGLALGVAASLLATFPAALEAASVPPVLAQRRSGLENRARRWVPGLVLLGLALGAVGTGIMNMPGTGLVPALAGVFLLLTGYALLTPAVLLILAGLLAWIPSIPVRLAVRGVSAALSRTGAATAALTVAVATAVGVGLMVESFRYTVSDWLEQLLQADLYVARPSEPGQPSPPLPASLIEAASRLPGVAAHSLARRAFVESSAGRIEILATQPAYPERPAFRFKSGDDQAIWRRFMGEDALLVSEPFAIRHGLKAGDNLTLATLQGDRLFPVAGVFFDYRSDQGLAVIRRDVYQRLWNDPGTSSMGIYLADGASLDAVRHDLQAIAQSAGALSIRSNREIRDASMEVFHRTFAITHVLRLLAIAVAFIGILSALLALQLERTREVAILRALGLTPRQLAGLVLTQTGFLGLCAGLLALPLGLLLAWALVAVINLRSFGWSMDLTVSGEMLGQAPVLALIAAVLGGVYPARRAARMGAAEGLREE